MESRKKLILGSYISVYIIWGVTYFLIARSVATISPAWVVALRFLSSGAALLTASFAMGQVPSRPTGRQILTSGFYALFLLVLGNGLVTLAETEVDSYLAALILAAQPVNMALMNFLFRGKKPGLLPSLGLVTGVFGVALLLYTGQGLSFHLTPSVLLVIGALIFFGFGSVMGGKLQAHPSLLFHSGLQMVMAGLVALVPALLEPEGAASLAAASPDSWWALGALSALGTLGILAYNYLIPREPAHRLSTYAFVNPLIALGLGLLLGGETPVPFLWPGMGLILASLALVIYGDRRR